MPDASAGYMCAPTGAALRSSCFKCQPSGSCPVSLDLPTTLRAAASWPLSGGAALAATHRDSAHAQALCRLLDVVLSPALAALQHLEAQNALQVCCTVPHQAQPAISVPRAVRQMLQGPAYTLANAPCLS
jgi:hypothetical protein